MKHIKNLWYELCKIILLTDDQTVDHPNNSSIRRAAQIKTWLNLSSCIISYWALILNKNYYSIFNLLYSLVDQCHRIKTIDFLYGFAVVFVNTPQRKSTFLNSFNCCHPLDIMSDSVWLSLACIFTSADFFLKSWYRDFKLFEKSLLFQFKQFEDGSIF